MIIRWKNNLFPHPPSKFGHVSLLEGSSEFDNVSLPKNTASVMGGNVYPRAILFFLSLSDCFLQLFLKPTVATTPENVTSTLDTSHTFINSSVVILHSFKNFDYDISFPSGP